MTRKKFIFCTGESGTGKSHFIDNYLPAGSCYHLKSATTRKMRDYEMDGREYYFRDENYFENEKLANFLFVNQQIWKPGEPKWLYGVPEFEIYEHLGENLVYDVIQPKYVRQLINWFKRNNLRSQYDFIVLWFLAKNQNMEIARGRQNMPNDMLIRTKNTCNENDFRAAHLNPRPIIYNKDQIKIDPKTEFLIKSLTPEHTH